MNTSPDRINSGRQTPHPSRAASTTPGAAPAHALSPSRGAAEAASRSSQQHQQHQRLRLPQQRGRRPTSRSLSDEGVTSRDRTPPRDPSTSPRIVSGRGHPHDLRDEANALLADVAGAMYHFNGEEAHCTGLAAGIEGVYTGDELVYALEHHVDRHGRALLSFDSDLEPLRRILARRGFSRDHIIMLAIMQRQQTLHDDLVRHEKRAMRRAHIIGMLVWAVLMGHTYMAEGRRAILPVFLSYYIGLALAAVSPYVGYSGIVRYYRQVVKSSFFVVA
ncbi:hypothetical protein PTSG_09016 [Salpingoeca rosetta]|uniref:Uncharacterized protein n=1 Tax=Salpingoeca rosetta (strain ATCC 50818 / BSB-021) TaxID=946362 RepID=F2ULY9_SALR5|nr:uncharacterized protein PTSG_09016 [Salpingoeca rosetta]EGD78138.1 hypothetical protein PTSG_09016 [Salpingoeca rosetta]|eukprot:XP_004989814.1 hypothetical protein PTSG_09016 [Salpingoeca rosetta]